MNGSERDRTPDRSRESDEHDGSNGDASKRLEHSEPVFVINAPIRELSEFRRLAEMATRLQPFGRVELNVGTLADKGFHEIPPGNNFWHEYASYNPTPFKFFPDERIEPFVPDSFVERNRRLLLGKVEILREFDLGAAFWSYEPNFLPEEFFEAHPQLRGPRVDHPRRSNHAAFAPCVSRSETQEMFAAMVSELVDHVPELNTFFFKTNDAGTGICWSDWLYPGPNGPTACRDRTTGERVATLMNAFKDGATAAGESITIHLTGPLFTDEEQADIRDRLPEGCHVPRADSTKIRSVGSRIGETYPVKGLFDPVSIIETGQSVLAGDTETVFLNFRASYDRDHERLDTIENCLSVLESTLRAETAEDESTSELLEQVCRDWAGESEAATLRECFERLRTIDQNKGYDYVSGISWGVAARQITRPLVIAPDRLSRAEEEYFLPYVFNVSTAEARTDYVDTQGAHRDVDPDAVADYVSRVEPVIETITEVSETAPEQVFLDNVATALEIHNSVLRSARNFVVAQTIRESNEEALEGPPRRPDKDTTWEGDPDFQRFNRVMRDELDNTQELIALLENGGLELITTADDPAHEDTFVLGPDLLEQLERKREIMIDHWRDPEGYLTPPFK